jgi:translation initiation factor 2B subunit (eIF-2B alpha/beta/delta family)
MTPVVTVFLRHRGDVLLLKRSQDVDSYAGKWGAVAGHVENGDPEASARAEIEEETGLTESQVSLVRAGDQFEVEDEERGTTWTVHPFLFDAETQSVETNWETGEADWVAPTAILRREVVPELWTSYRRIAPTILSIADDATRGSAALSEAALEVLRDRAGQLAVSETVGAEEARERLVEVAERLLAARPSMAAVQNRVHRAMYESRPDFTPLGVEGTAHAGIARAADADRRAAERAAEMVAGKRVLTLSRSGTVLDALRRAFRSSEDAPSLVVAESRPAREGIGVAEALVEGGGPNEERDVTVCTDAAVPAILAEGDVDLVLVGADTVRPSGAVVNKTGTRAAALAAAREEVPFYAVCAADKIAAEEEDRAEEGGRRAVYDGTAGLHVRNPTFDVTPADLVTGGIVTERRTYAPADVAAVADDHAGLATWREDV